MFQVGKGSNPKESFKKLTHIKWNPKEQFNGAEKKQSHLNPLILRANCQVSAIGAEAHAADIEVANFGEGLVH